MLYYTQLYQSHTCVIVFHANKDFHNKWNNLFCTVPTQQIIYIYAHTTRKASVFMWHYWICYSKLQWWNLFYCFLLQMQIRQRCTLYYKEKIICQRSQLLYEIFCIRPKVCGHLTISRYNPPIWVIALDFGVWLWRFAHLSIKALVRSGSDGGWGILRF